MKKEDLTFAVVGIAAGLVLGFLIANWTTTTTNEGVVAKGQVESVNGGGQQLPPGHPDISAQNGNGSQSAPAGQLPPGHPSVAGGGQAGEAGPIAEAGGPNTSAGPSADLPSLEPLAAGSKEERTEQKYKNIQVLKGLPADRLMSIMFAFKSSLGVDCTFCHVKDQWEKDDKENKQTARKMIKMVETDNQQLGGIGRVTCYTCHKGQERPAS